MDDSVFWRKKLKVNQLLVFCTALEISQLGYIERQWTTLTHVTVTHLTHINSIIMRQNAPSELLCYHYTIKQCCRNKCKLNNKQFSLKYFPTLSWYFPDSCQDNLTFPDFPDKHSPDSTLSINVQRMAGSSNAFPLVLLDSCFIYDGLHTIQQTVSKHSQ